MSTLDELALRFQRFADLECGDSPLYRRLASGVAGDPELLALAGCARSTPKTNLFFASVHYLLLKRPGADLARFYPTINRGGDLPTEDPFPHFRTFCLAHGAEIVSLLESRRVQTNEVNRAAYLLPAFHRIYRETQRPLALVEVGTSAGLLLSWDRYHLDYGAAGQGGDLNSPVHLQCEVRGERKLPLPAAPPPVAIRSGIDLHPVDLRDPDQALWLRALVWGDQPERQDRLAAAIALVGQEVPALVAGSAEAVLPGVLAQAQAADVTRVIFHSHALNQFPPELKQRFIDVVREQSLAGDIYRLALEFGADARVAEMRLSLYQRGEETGHWLLAKYDGHGNWIEWLD